MGQKRNVFQALILIAIWVFVAFGVYLGVLKLLSEPDFFTASNIFLFIVLLLFGAVLLASLYEVVRYGRSSMFFGGANSRSIGELLTKQNRRRIGVRVVLLQGQWFADLWFEVPRRSDSSGPWPFLLSKAELGELIGFLKKSREELNQAK